ncbi:MAG TPA: hypothetical protein DE109_11045 [Aeromonas sp.]|nr:hypothetical protein [Aeromonas sp.]
MDRGEMMREKRRVTSVDLIKLLKRIDNYSDTLICVFEGEDAKYYGPRIDNIFNKTERKNLPCKGKKNVLSLREKVKQNIELSKAKILYFVDSDFDGDCSDSDIYCTPCYSIENFYAHSCVLDKILKDEFALCSFKDDELIKAICSHYEKLELNVDESLLDLNAWIFVRKDEIKLGTPISLNLDNVEIDKIIKINDDASVIKIYTERTLDDLFSVDTKLDYDKFNTIREELKKQDLKLVSRGKYRLEFFRCFLSKLVDDARKANSFFHGEKKKPRLFLSKQQLLSELTQYAITPECLMNFLRNNSHT